MAQQRDSAKDAVAKRRRPEGWPVGSFDTYEQAQQAVDMLSDQNFSVDGITIVGVDLMEVERVTGRLTWGRVILGGAASGAWLGLFFGLLIGIFGGTFLTPLLTGVVMGAVFGIILAVVPYAMSGGRRDFTSQTQIVAGRYDILCVPELARQARDAIARSGLAGPATPNPGPQPRQGSE
ncbi:general stress protein [Corynebacterium halotolerans]|uniref:general stress protein n=1 Tax=Corynebacterium halotolerans TaxID=225326 RepID=UPI003CEC46DB